MVLENLLLVRLFVSFEPKSYHSYHKLVVFLPLAYFVSFVSKCAIRVVIVPKPLQNYCCFLMLFD